MSSLTDLEITASRLDDYRLSNLLWWAVAEIRKLRKQVRTLKAQRRGA